MWRLRREGRTQRDVKDEFFATIEGRCSASEPTGGSLGRERGGSPRPDAEPYDVVPMCQVWNGTDR